MRGRLGFAIKLLALLFCIWLGGFITYAQEVSEPNSATLTSADGIVILTGTPARLKVGLDLLREGAAKRVLISGVNKQISSETLRIAMGESQKIMDCCVDLGRNAKDTVGNAFEASIWAEEHGFDSLLVVTSAYHMPRSLVEFKRQMPAKTLYAYPTLNENLLFQHWWQKPSAGLILASEYNKYVVSLIRANLERLAMAGDRA
ncbi:YdcF family protein [Sneathiella limimaris]|uniref:YdcF family protein n=1 Tax=Sneathiella limimaris TaxID=1964213 RepID=UPI001469D704|nr:YdcF family protein [Sneathiella limimaris]